MTTLFWLIGGISTALFALSLILGDFLDGVFDSLDFTGGYLSSASIFGFGAAFGFGGIIATNSGLGPLLTVIIASASGVAAGLAAALLIRWLNSESDTQQVTLADYPGNLAKVIIPIDPDSSGKIVFELAGNKIALIATSSERIESGQDVLIVEAVGPSTVSVVPVSIPKLTFEDERETNNEMEN